MFINGRGRLFLSFVFFIWLKSIFAYFFDFSLGASGFFQYFILLINPLATASFFLGLSLFVRGKKTSYFTLFFIYILLTSLLFANVIYYREFTSFITINTLKSASQVTKGLGSGVLELLQLSDILYWIDIPILLILFTFKKFKMEPKHIKGRQAIALSLFSITFFLGNLSLAQMDRPQLLTRTFSADYLVKYLGIPAFSLYDSIKTYQTNQIRANASENDLAQVVEFIQGNQARPNDELFGIAKGKNVIYIHLESFQQFLIDYHLEDENGQKHEVTPFLNSIYHSDNSFSFADFFHQVAAGKTSDAETLIENSFFGLAQGPLFTQLGSQNTFFAMPAILGQKGYTSAVFHGNSGNFWNRMETYKNFGVDFFFDSNYFELTLENSFQYGLHDKELFTQSQKYLERLQQPFYAKFITVSNHFPYNELAEDVGFPQAMTRDSSVNGYFSTANYLDRAIEEFFDYLKSSGLYEQSIFVIYGDHYGISNARNVELATILTTERKTWGEFDNVMLQRVPYMIYLPGFNEGSIKENFAGQIDSAPTLLHLLGIQTGNFLHLGQDMLSSEHNNLVVFRNGTIVTPTYTMIGTQDVYFTQTGLLIEEFTPEMEKEIENIREFAALKLSKSDRLTNGDLLRFYHESQIDFVNPIDFSYQNSFERLLEIEKRLGNQSTSLFSQNN
ncbi:MAG: LTA synthase family protein [Streptococcaceae bacterium]|nr:LTA synthase family protein [Streptococcaceae bacterium]